MIRVDKNEMLFDNLVNKLEWGVQCSLNTFKSDQFY